MKLMNADEFTLELTLYESSHLAERSNHLCDLIMLFTTIDALGRY